MVGIHAVLADTSGPADAFGVSASFRKVLMEKDVSLDALKESYAQELSRAVSAKHVQRYVSNMYRQTLESS